MKIKIIAIVLIVLTAGAVFAQNNDYQPAAQITLTKTETITVKTLKTELDNAQKMAGRPLAKDEKQQVLDGLIDEKLILQDAEKRKITVSESEINKQLEQLRTQMAQARTQMVQMRAQLEKTSGKQLTETEFANIVKSQTGVDPSTYREDQIPAYKEEMRKQAIFQKYLLDRKPDLPNSIKIPNEKDIVDFYNLHKAELVRPDTVRCSMILVAFTDNASKTNAKATADRLAKDINSNPGRFDETALKGQLPNAGYQSGDFGYVPRTEVAQQSLGSEFISIAFNMKQGEVSKVIETKQGYLIIKVTETYEQKQLALDDIFQFGGRITVRDYIGNGLLQQRQQDAILQAQADIIKELRRGKPFTINEANIRSLMN